MLGSHCVKTWSSNQQVIALSSGEAEYYGLVKGATIAMGVQGMLSDFGVNCGIELRTDASAAKGIASRRGLGKVRRIELAQLWLQDHVANGRIRIVKIAGSDNYSDSLTKPASVERVNQTLYHTGQVCAQGRHRIMSEVAE